MISAEEAAAACGAFLSLEVFERAFSQQRKQNWSKWVPKRPWQDWYSIKDPSLTGKEEHLHRVSEPSKHDSTFWETKALRSADGKVKLLRAIGKAVIYGHVSLLCLWTRRTPESLSLLPGLSGKRPCFWMSTSSSSFSLLTFASMVMRVMFDHTVSNRDDFSFEK